MGHPLLTPPSLLIIYGPFIRDLWVDVSNDPGGRFRPACKSGLCASLSNQLPATGEPGHD